MSSKKRTLVNAFNPVPLVEHVLPDRPRIEVSCLSVWENCLYVGTQCGLVIYYFLEEQKSPLGKVLYQSKIKGRIQLGSERHKPVQQLTILHAHKKLLALVDGFLHVMHMNTLELFDTGQKVSRIQTYCINESKSGHAGSTGNLEVLVAPQRKRLLQMYAFTGEKLLHLKDFNLPEVALCVARDEEFVCVALSPSGSGGGEGRYIMLNIMEGKSSDLLNYESGSTPLVKRTGHGEFLINTGHFAIMAFVATRGSNRPPVDWSSCPPKSASYIFPYVVGWSQRTDKVHVFSLLDQKCIQEVPFPNGRFLGDFSGRLYGAQGRAIYYYPQVPLREQVNLLLEKQLVEEAVLLAETISAVESSRDRRQAEQYVYEVKQRAAFVCLASGSFSKCEVLLLESGCDPREVIVLFGDILPATSSFKPQTPSIHALPPLQELVDSKILSLKEAKKFLIRYLKEVRSTQLVVGRREDIDTSLVKLLAEEHSPSLIPYIENQELHLAFEDTLNALEKYECFHALGLLYYYSNQTSSALSIWTRICDSKLKDPSFPGFPFIVDFLSKYAEHEVVLEYAKWALEKDEEMAINIFTNREDSSLLPAAQVLDFLTNFPTATVAYLEYVIHQQGSKEEEFHTKLARHYIDDVLRLLDDESATRRVMSAREKLLAFLEESQCYHAPILLSKVHDTTLYRECALLYGRMEEHEKALQLLAHKLKDFSQAEEYCRLYSQDRSRQYRQNLFQLLLGVYLQPKEKSHDTLVRPALSLLNSHGAAFDAAQVLELLPPDWPIQTVKVFLLRSLRSNVHTFRMERIQHHLARGENLQVRNTFIKKQGGPVVITESTCCPVCNLPFNDAAFVRYPNGTVTHLKCGKNKSICPVTGTWFSGE